MARIIDRNKQIPGGFRFYQPETNWRSQRFASFNTIVNALIAHRKANKFLAQKNGWATDYNSVANEVDAFNAAICEHAGWKNYITQDGGFVPKFQPPLQLLRPGEGGVGNVVAGALTLAELFGPGRSPVKREIADGRASVCAQCPINQSGSLSSWFTEPAANLIRKTLAFLNDMNLKTSMDDQLHICAACDCPMKLKVWVPIEHIKKHITSKSMKLLHPTCWIPKE